MTSPKPSPLDALAGLLEERRRFEGWLEQLAARSADTPQHVVERVRADYHSRLGAVITQLRSRTTELESSVREFDEHSTGLLGQINARRDERAEAELRAAVGEFTAEEAHTILSRCDEEIGRLSSEREGVNSELGRIRDVLESVREPQAEPRAPQPPPVAAAASQVQPPPQPAPAPQVAAAQAAPPPAAPQAAPPPAAPQAAPQAAPPPPPAAPLHGTDPAAFDELAFLQSVVQPSEAGARAPAQEFASGSAPRRPAPGGEGGTQREGQAPEAATGSRTAAATPENLDSFLKGAPTEHVKTLKCQECGTMNYPTEWYCERCGGELAAM